MSCFLLDPRVPCRFYDKRFGSQQDVGSLTEPTSTCRRMFTENGAVAIGKDVIVSSLYSRRDGLCRAVVCTRESRLIESLRLHLHVRFFSQDHLELTSDLSTNEFSQALIRIISRRGLCSTIWSDNAKTFKCADREIQRSFTSESSNSKQLWDKIDQEELQAK